MGDKPRFLKWFCCWRITNGQRILDPHYNFPMTPLPTFPNGAHCAVSLTYDDGIASHFEDVGPTLEANGLRGTFNITIARASVMEHTAEWRAMAATN